MERIRRREPRCLLNGGPHRRIGSVEWLHRGPECTRPRIQPGYGVGQGGIEALRDQDEDHGRCQRLAHTRQRVVDRRGQAGAFDRDRAHQGRGQGRYDERDPDAEQEGCGEGIDERREGRNERCRVACQGEPRGRIGRNPKPPQGARGHQQWPTHQEPARPEPTSERARPGRNERQRNTRGETNQRSTER